MLTRKTGEKCHYCGVELVNRPYPTLYNVAHNATTIDHIVPKSKGGGDHESNLVPCCWLCNSVKRAKDYDVFLKSDWLYWRRWIVKVAGGWPHYVTFRDYENMKDFITRHHLDLDAIHCCFAQMSIRPSFRQMNEKGR